jgi:hypothetical protein
MSKGIKEVVKLNTKYTAMSTNRHDANISYNNYNLLLSKGDTLGAFLELNKIPKSHQISNDLRISRINLAAQLNDSIFAEVINREIEINNNLYIEYLIGHYLDDSIQNIATSRRIANEIGINLNLLDSLKNKGLVWH